MKSFTEMNYIEEIKARLEDLYNCEIEIVTGGLIDFGFKVENDDLTVKDELRKITFIAHQLKKHYQFDKIFRHKNMVNVYK